MELYWFVRGCDNMSQGRVRAWVVISCRFVFEVSRTIFRRYEKVEIFPDKNRDDREEERKKFMSDY